MTKQVGYLETPWTMLRITVSNNKLVSIDFENTPRERDVSASDPLIIRVKNQLAHYFRDSTSEFDLDVEVEGTAFQKKVWQSLRTIPVGTVVTYGELARRLKTSPRALGGACRANPIPIVVPCHRVVSRSGIGGFSGANEGANVLLKRALLKHEGIIV